jgi:hypothetical protein
MMNRTGKACLKLALSFVKPPLFARNGSSGRRCQWWPSTANVRARQPSTSTAQGASVSTQTVASVSPA